MGETLYLFDGYNLLNAGQFESPRELVDLLASFVAMRGATGVVVFDGRGPDAERGSLSVRYAPHADDLLERLAAEHRERRHVVLVTSDATVAGTAGAVEKLASHAFARELRSPRHSDGPSPDLAERLDPETRERMERLRRGE